MSLSAREQRVLFEIERDLAKSNRDAAWVTAMIAGLVVGIAILSAGGLLGIPAMMVAGTVLAQLSPVVLVARGLPAWLSRSWRTVATRDRWLLWRR